MKRLFTVFALCATALIAAGTITSPAAADGRHDGRRHAEQFDRQTSWYFADRGRRLHKFRRHHKRQRYARSYVHRHAYGYRHRHGYGPPPRYRYGYRTSATYALRFDGARFIFRFD